MIPLLPLLLAASVAPGPAANPCDVLDLASALTLAARRSDEVAIREAEVHVAQADRAIAAALRVLPIASVTAIVGPVPAAHGDVLHASEGTSNRSLHGLGPFVRIDGSAIQPLWTWGQLDAARDAANAGVSARELLVKSQVQAVQLRIVQLFWAQVLARKLLVLATDVEKSLGEVNQKIDEALAAEDGSISTEDRFRVKLFEGLLGQRRADAQRGLEQARIGLAATLALDPSGVQFEAPALDPGHADLPVLTALLADADAQRPDLKALDEAIKAREAELAAGEAGFLPTIFLAGQFSFAYAANRDIQTNPWVNDPFRTVGGGVVLGARQNLAFPTMRAQLMKVEAELDTLRAQRQGAHRLVQVEVEGAYADAVAARDRLAAAQGSLGAGKSWFRSAALNFGLGVDDAKALLDAYSGYVESQVGLASASYDLIVARARLDQLTGKALSQGEGTCKLP
jgi:outer membrane protein TolC